LALFGAVADGSPLDDDTRWWWCWSLSSRPVFGVSNQGAKSLVDKQKDSEYIYSAGMKPIYCMA
jgi:hypothetical protein